MRKLWEPWVRWACGASFDRRRQEHIPEAGLQLIEARFVVDELIQLISAHPALVDARQGKCAHQYAA